jgi:hypothetical protein
VHSKHQIRFLSEDKNLNTGLDITDSKTGFAEARLQTGRAVKLP